MLTRAIPASGEAMPVIGLGTHKTFDVGSAPETRGELGNILQAFVDAGGSMIDSSPMYGRAEEVCGDVLAETGLKASAFIATKVWTRGRKQGIAQMRESMALLRSPVIDLMQIHNLLDWQTQLATLRDWQDEGLIRYIGITHYTTGAFRELEDVMVREQVDFVQLPYSIAVRAAEDRILSVAADRGVGVIPNRPYDGGHLFDAVRGRSLPDWAAEFDCTGWGQFFLKYILGHPAVTCVIPATGNIDHLPDLLAAGEGHLPDADQRARMATLIEDL
jgi:aryl-alcohol dehydrogenase-like predicted oxidoreductase